MNTVIIVSVLFAAMLVTIAVQNVMAVLTPPPCLKNTSSSGPWTDYFNMVKGIYHCQTFDVTVLHESASSVMLHYLDSDNSETAITEEAGVLNWHILSHQDDGVVTTDVLVPNP